MAMNIELFVSDCNLCAKTKEMVKKVKGPKCSLKVYNLAKGEGAEEVEKYGITAVPTIVGNGRKMFEGVPEFKELVQCSLEHGCKGRSLR
ncbi:MAG: thioredoxin family protein [Candidatus Aenigmarchaeota archaeon]|nr:thioredoxin family protein [Candidatus Aenigmarchaeota archaeon]